MVNNSTNIYKPINHL